MVGSLSEGLLLAFILYPFNIFKAAAFVHPKATFGWSSWTHDQSRRLQQPTCCGEPSPSSSGRRPRQRGERSCNKEVRMQADATDMETHVPGAASSSLTQFDNRESAEVDSFMGELNFCLGPSDSVLSGPSLLKDLNTATNKIVKNLLILNSPEDSEPAMRDALRIEADFDAQHSESPQYSAAKAYLSCVRQLAIEGCPAVETLDALSEVYKRAFRRVAGVLSDFGCTITPGDESGGRIRPVDKDICLSILDYAVSAREQEGTTPTRALNTLVNRVVRTVCVGSDEDLQALAGEMESKHNKFMTKCFGKGSWQGTQEDMFYHALINLVKHGLTDEGVPALSGAYLNSYQRLMGILVQEVGTRSTPASEMVLKSFLAWEREIRKELTEPAWKSRPPDLVGSWALDTSGWDGLTDLPVDSSAAGGGTTDGMVDLGLSDLVVSFRKDGTVQIPVEKGVGLQWRVEPGPTHLDTIYFEMIPAAPKVKASSKAGAGGGTTLSYTGYVDRGARIEARFSKRFLKMTGRMTSVERGQERPSTRFAMRLVARGEGKGLLE
ncbi:unnamed protein product [Ectocarpus sp. 12 AP-2014]